MSSSHSTLSKADLSAAQTTLGGAANPLFFLCGGLGLAGLGIGFALGWNRADNLQYFLHSYLWNYCFVLGIALGALFFVLLQHATRAGWSVTVRRLAEFLTAPFGLLAVLFLPILIPVILGHYNTDFVRYNIYEWANPAAVHESEVLAHKAAYLNPTFFAVRAVFYFGVWWYLGRFYLAKSVEQDRTGDACVTLRLERCSYVSILFYAATVTFASIDWLMSLMPDWFSTIFGLYYFSGCMVAIMAVLILASIALQAAGRLTDAVTVEHYHDLGKFLFTFVVFWGYIAFSQYLLIWYANIPEETQWYLLRQNGAWKWISLALLFGQLLIPFAALLSRHVKRQKYLLGFSAAWVLAMHWLDLYWVVMPSMKTERPPFNPIDVCLLVGLVGLYAAGVLRAAAGRSLIPRSDPRLEEALAFENT
ncbi:MAG: quinol:cytochrome C oxidoreductase [Pirellulales bacterium]|nr:quinol:cytochrome C oxidoreductase [Pirellulales bacterium]